MLTNKGLIKETKEILNTKSKGMIVNMVSLCPHCNCITHTTRIKTLLCAKCGKHKKVVNKPAKWKQALWKDYENYEFLMNDDGYVQDMRKKEV